MEAESFLGISKAELDELDALLADVDGPPPHQPQSHQPLHQPLPQTPQPQTALPALQPQPQTEPSGGLPADLAEVLAELKAEPLFPGDADPLLTEMSLDRIEISILGEPGARAVAAEDVEVVDIGGPEDLRPRSLPAQPSQPFYFLQPDGTPAQSFLCAAASPTPPGQPLSRTLPEESLSQTIVAADPAAFPNLSFGPDDAAYETLASGSSMPLLDSTAGSWVELETPAGAGQRPSQGPKAKAGRGKGVGRRPRPEPILTEAQVYAAHQPYPIQVSQLERLPDKRPTFSYVAMVTMVLRASATGCLTLQEVYQHISQAFPYYRLSERKWQNSIRHTMSFNDCFIRVHPARGLADKAKERGQCWTLHPDAGEMFVPGTTSVRRRSKKFRLPGKLPPKRRSSSKAAREPKASQPAAPSPVVDSPRPAKAPRVAAAKAPKAPPLPTLALPQTSQQQLFAFAFPQTAGQAAALASAQSAFPAYLPPASQAHYPAAQPFLHTAQPFLPQAYLQQASQAHVLHSLAGHPWF